jgi:two-component system, sensor histidine kinase and response regulator
MSPSQSPGQKVNILLVDDLPANLDALRVVLDDLGQNLVEAQSGKEALQRLLEDDFAVILLDVQMYDLDGFETARLLRIREKSWHTPIIFLTAHDTDRNVVEQAYTLGAVEFLTKPFVPVILKAKVTVFVELFQKTAQLKLQAEELKAANKELEAFSYSVSHDLRAPLRAIDGFSRILLEEHGQQLPEEAREYLELVRRNTKQMGFLVDDLLSFSRLSRQQVKKQTVAPAKIVRQCLEELRGEQNGRRVEITLGDLPPCLADPSLLKQVWFNLLSNAFKYTRKREVALIDVGCRGDDPEARTYFVRDNGVGFDMQYAPKLFGVFQRLHRAEDYEGTGVGLAIVQRIVLRHGGRVWAEAQPGEGATFSFTLEGDSK